MLCEHELPGTARHDPLADPDNRTGGRSIISLAARELLPLDPANTHLIVEHEYPRGAYSGSREINAHPERVDRIHAENLDEAAACMYALQREVLGAQKIPVQGIGRQAYRS